MTLHAYHQQYLHVNLSRRTSESVPIPEKTLRGFLGGVGLGTYLLLKHNAASLDPLDPASPLIFVFSPLVGSPLTTSAKFAVLCKSPLTDRINDSLASSSFAISGKKTGYDAIVITGTSESPTVLVVDEQSVSFKSSDDVWNATCSQTSAKLTEEFGSQFKSAVIGPAGENLVRYATISHDGRHAGRGGSGAVMGSKKLKAVLVRGNKKTTWAHPDSLVQYARDLSEKSYGPATAKYRELGTAANLLVFNRLNCLPTRNFQQSQFESAQQLSPQALSKVREKTRGSCAACTIGCEHIYKVEDGSNGAKSVRLEYENLFALGPLCGIGDGDVVLAASNKCDELGMDTISAGGTIAFAMECVEKGLISKADCDLNFGDSTALLLALDQIAARTGFGNQLAEGSRRLAQEVGNDSIHFAPQVKGLEIPGYEPRALQTMGLGFAVGTRGADHNRSGAYEVDFSESHDRKSLSVTMASKAVETEDKAAIMDSMILCKFLRGVFEDLLADAAKMLTLTSGWEITREEMAVTAKRIVSAKKLFNLRAGWTPAEDRLPARFMSQATKDDANQPMSEDQLQAAIGAYNLARGWTEEGFLSEDTLNELDTLLNASAESVKNDKA